jgi:solute carrier family 25 (mitochondrial folate transporter), member 32
MTEVLTAYAIVDATSQSRIGSSLQVLRGIIHNEGPTRLSALYRGLTPNLLGNSLGWALYFLWYRQAQDVIRSYRGYNADKPLSSLDYLTASAASGILSAVFTNPIWVIKTRMLSTSATQHGAYPSMISGLKSIWQGEGYRGMFQGLVPTLAGVSHGALYFMAYEKLKAERRRSKNHQPLTNFDTILTSSLSKVFAGGLTYPHQLVRARMQMYNPGDLTLQRSLGVVGVMKQIWRHEGIFGFYKGLGPNLLRVVPSTCVTFLVYENVKWTLPRMLGERKDTIKDGAI